MRGETQPNQSWNGRTITIIALSLTDRARKIEGIVAQRAFQISEGRGFGPGHELEDWQRAESEVCSPLCAGLTLGSDSILIITTAAACFIEGPIEICVEPRRLTLFGKQRLPAEHFTPEENRSKLQEREVLRILNLPVVVDPSAVTARFSHCMLEIALPRAGGTCASGVESYAA